MGRWTERDEERVSPTARWLFCGVWKILFTLLVIFVIGVVIAVIAEAVS
jgi:hypothetical protein